MAGAVRFVSAIARKRLGNGSSLGEEASNGCGVARRSGRASCSVPATTSGHVEWVHFSFVIHRSTPQKRLKRDRGTSALTQNAAAARIAAALLSFALIAEARGGGGPQVDGT